MTMPKKGTRRVHVHDKAYRYTFKSYGGEDFNISVFVQEDCDEPGNVLQIDLDKVSLTDQSLSEHCTRGWGIRPGDVVQLIRQSIEAGWEPSKKGPAVKLKHEYQIVRHTARVGAIEVFRHSPGPCRHCGHVFEKAGMCGCGLFHCPKCGCPVEEPDNK